MLPRFFDKDNKRVETEGTNQPVGQGSLLDAFENADPAQSSNPTVLPFPKSAPAAQSGSFLNSLDDADMEMQRQAMHQSDLSDKQSASQWDNGHQSSPNSSLRSRVREEAPQAEQLDLLAEELSNVRSRLHQSEEAQSRASHPPEYSQAPHPGYSSHYAPSQPPQRSEVNNPFSFDRTIVAVLKASKLMILCAILGCIASVLYALNLPNEYESIAEILIEPRELKVLENTVSPNGLNTDATIAYAESQVRIINSSSVIDPAIAELELIEDPEFNGSGVVGGSVGKFIGMVTGGGEASSGDMAAVKKYLFNNLFVSRINQTFTIQIGMTTTDPAKSARIANAIAKSYFASSSGARSSAAGSASEDLEGRLDELRNKVRMSEENVEAYRAETGLLDANGQLVSEVQLGRLNDQLTLAKVQTGDARTRAQLASETDLGDVISGTLPSTLRTTTINQLRLEYTKTKSRLDRLSTRLGERHPDRIAAAAELRSSLDAIGQEMKRIVQSAQEDFKRAKAREADLLRQVNELKASAVTDSAAKVKLRELDREVAANRRVYESFLLRARETGEEQNIRSSSARVISEAIPVDQKKGPKRKLIVAGGTAGGAILGAILALIPFGFSGLRQIVNSASQSQQPQQHQPQVQPTQTGLGSGDLYTTETSPPQHYYTPTAPPRQETPQPITQPATVASVQQPVQPVAQPAAQHGMQMPLPGFAMAPAPQTPIQPVAQSVMQPIYVQAPPMMAQAPVQQMSPQPQMVYSNWVPVEPK